MKKPAPPPDVDDCLDRLQAAVDVLTSEGVNQKIIQAALIQLTLRALKKERDPARSIDQAARIFLDYADRAFEKGKQDRAAKRAKALGLTDED